MTGSSTSGSVTILAGGSGSWPAANPQVNISIGNDAAVAGDRADFVIISASRDPNQQKRLQFAAVPDGGYGTFNNGRSRITVAQGAGFKAVGTQANPTIIDMLPGSGTAPDDSSNL